MGERGHPGPPGPPGEQGLPGLAGKEGSKVRSRCVPSGHSASRHALCAPAASWAAAVSGGEPAERSLCDCAFQVNKQTVKKNRKAVRKGQSVCGQRTCVSENLKGMKA